MPWILETHYPTFSWKLLGFPFTHRELMSFDSCHNWTLHVSFLLAMPTLSQVSELHLPSVSPAGCNASQPVETQVSSSPQEAGPDTSRQDWACWCQPSLGLLSCTARLKRARGCLQRGKKGFCLFSDKTQEAFDSSLHSVFCHWKARFLSRKQ